MAYRNAAYNEYMLSDEYNVLTQISLERTVKSFFEYKLEKFIKIAFRKHWGRILFMPWTIETSPEIFDFGPLYPTKIDE